ncbi:MAG: acyltransferase, partial [Chitinophagaceae bacterium]
HQETSMIKTTLAASLLVCLFHLSLGNRALLPSSFLHSLFSAGYVGVESFFILSGYVICYAFPRDTSTRNTCKFLLKRATRIEPPYIASILLVLLLGFLSACFTGNKVVSPDSLQLLAHLLYFNNFSPSTYINTVYWTLGIEFQFYLIIAFLFPYLQSSGRSCISALAFFFLFSFLQFSSGALLVFSYLPYFGLGIVVYFQKQKAFANKLLPLILCLFLLRIFAYAGFSGMLAAALVAAVLFFWRYSNNVIRFFSMISFSLYLTHVPLGGKIINLGLRYFHSRFEHYLLFVIAFLFSIAFAYVFYRVVERPSLSLAKRIQFAQNPDTVIVVAEKNATRREKAIAV